MLIDWFTVGAQMLNFLILVWLLKRVLYKPILHAIDEREKRFAMALADADAKKAEAQQQRDEFQQKNETFDQERAALLIQAKDEVKAERQRLLDEARKAVAALSSKRLENLRIDAHNLNQAISRRTQQEVFAIARKALSDLAGMSLEERMVDVFVHRLGHLNGKQKSLLAAALNASPGQVVVRTAFELPLAQHASIEAAVNSTLGAPIPMQFENAPELVSGIELATNGQKIGWNIADYLTSLEKDVEELLNETNRVQGKPEAKSEGSTSHTKSH